jgi:hypothetical protein
MPEQQVSSALRRLVWQRANGCCEYCRSQERFAPESFSIEHIYPRSRGGRTHSDNLALSCQGCNSHKFTRIVGYDPLTGDDVPLFNPRLQHWSTHFTWNEDYTAIVGLTTAGRATITTLHLNRAGLINLQRVLTALDEHPPS